MADEEKVIKELEHAGLSVNDLGADYWIEYIVQYRKTGKCGSVMFSTIEFIPILSKLLKACSESKIEDRKHELIEFKACTFGDGGFYYHDGADRAVCSCGWESAAGQDKQALVALWEVHNKTA